MPWPTYDDLSQAWCQYTISELEEHFAYLQSAGFAGTTIAATLTDWGSYTGVQPIDRNGQGSRAPISSHTPTNVTLNSSWMNFVRLVIGTADTYGLKVGVITCGNASTMPEWINNSNTGILRTTSAYSFGQELANYLGDLSNIAFWIHGWNNNDVLPNAGSRNEGAIFGAVTNGIKDHALYANQMEFTAACGKGNNGEINGLRHANESWLDFHYAQSGHVNQESSNPNWWTTLKDNLTSAGSNKPIWGGAVNYANLGDDGNTFWVGPRPDALEKRNDAIAIREALGNRFKGANYSDWLRMTWAHSWHGLKPDNIITDGNFDPGVKTTYLPGPNTTGGLIPYVTGSQFSGVNLSELAFGNWGTAPNFTYASSFQAVQTGYVKAAELYMVWDSPGYGGGDGGNLTVQVRPADPLVPINKSTEGATGVDTSRGGPHASTVLGTMSINGPINAYGHGGLPNGSRNAAWTFEFEEPVFVTEGNYYYIVANNTATKVKSGDWCSAESIAAATGPLAKDFVLWYDGGWRLRRLYGNNAMHNQPQQVIIYDDGTRAGPGYIGSAYYSDVQRVIGGSSKVRQVGPFPGTYDEVFIHVGRHGSSATLQLSVDGGSPIDGVEQGGQGGWDPRSIGPPSGTSTGEIWRSWWKFTLDPPVTDPTSFEFSSSSTAFTASALLWRTSDFQPGDYSAGFAEWSTGGPWTRFSKWGYPTMSLHWYATGGGSDSTWLNNIGNTGEQFWIEEMDVDVPVTEHTLTLEYSINPDLSNPQPLNGASLYDDVDYYIFATVTPNDDVADVTFYLDDVFHRTDVSPTYTYDAYGIPTGTSISKAGWSLIYADSQEPSTPATMAFDGNDGTYWHTKWSPTADPLPHEIQIDLGDTYDITAFTYKPRTDSSNGRIANYEFYVGYPYGAESIQVSGGLSNTAPIVGRCDSGCDDPPVQASSTYMGSGMTAAGLMDRDFGNIQPYGHAQSFVSRIDGYVNSVRIYMTWEYCIRNGIRCTSSDTNNGGYGAGNAGNLQVQIRPSDPGVVIDNSTASQIEIPTGGPHATQVLGSSNILYGPKTMWDGWTGYTWAAGGLWEFNPPVQVQKGLRYWFVAQNHVEPHPQYRHFCSMETLRHSSGPRAENYVLIKLGSGAWQISNVSPYSWAHDTPSHDILYSDGVHDGMGYMHATNYSYAERYVGGNHRVQQTGGFTGKIQDVYLFIGRRYAEGAALLQLSVDGGGVVNGTDQGAWGAYSPSGQAWHTGALGDIWRSWYKFHLPAPITNPSSFVWSSPTNAAFVASTLKKGTPLALHPGSMSEGYAQYTSGGGWSNIGDGILADLYWYAPIIP